MTRTGEHRQQRENQHCFRGHQHTKVPHPRHHRVVVLSQGICAVKLVHACMRSSLSLDPPTHSLRDTSYPHHTPGSIPGRGFPMHLPLHRYPSQSAGTLNEPGSWAGFNPFITQPPGVRSADGSCSPTLPLTETQTYAGFRVFHSETANTHSGEVYTVIPCGHC